MKLKGAAWPGNQVTNIWAGAGLGEDGFPLTLATLKAVFAEILMPLKQGREYRRNKQKIGLNKKQEKVIPTLKLPKYFTKPHLTPVSLKTLIKK